MHAKPFHNSATMSISQPQQFIEDHPINPLLAALSPLPLADSPLYPGAVLIIQRRPGVRRQVRKLLEAAVVQQVERGACG